MTTPIRAKFCVEHGAPLALYDSIMGQERYTCPQCPAQVLWWVDSSLMSKFYRGEDKSK